MQLVIFQGILVIFLIEKASQCHSSSFEYAQWRDLNQWQFTQQIYEAQNI